MKLKKSALGMAVAAIGTMGICGQAYAYLYAESGLSVDNLTINITNASTGTAASVVVNRFDFTLTNTAALNGSLVGSTATCGGVPGSNNCTQTVGSMDAAAVNAPGSAPVLRTNNQTTSLNNEFTLFGPGSGGNWSNSDSQIKTAELVNLGSPTSTRNVAESLLTTGTSASASSQIQSVTGFTISFTIADTANLSLSFLADPDLFAAISGQAPGSFSAGANLNASFTLAQNTGGNGSANWTPQGTAANDCAIAGGVGCTETADTQDLNINVGTTANNTSNSSSYDPNVLTETAFGINVTGLTAGTWTLTLNEVKSTSLAFTPAVPEPGTLALLGIGLAGLGPLARRRKAA